MLLNDNSSLLQLGSHFSCLAIISIEYDNIVLSKYTAEVPRTAW